MNAASVVNDDVDMRNASKVLFRLCANTDPQRDTIFIKGPADVLDSGIIAQEVTTWQRPTLMGLRVTENTLPGRHWLSFIDASYELFAEGTGTRIVRHTTIGTRLYPRWYWRPLERWGVTSEHDFVFSNLHRWSEAQ